MWTPQPVAGSPAGRCHGSASGRGTGRGLPVTVSSPRSGAQASCPGASPPGRLPGAGPVCAAGAQSACWPLFCRHHPDAAGDPRHHEGPGRPHRVPPALCQPGQWACRFLLRGAQGLAQLCSRVRLALWRCLGRPKCEAALSRAWAAFAATGVSRPFGPEPGASNLMPWGGEGKAWSTPTLRFAPLAAASEPRSALPHKQLLAPTSAVGRTLAWASLGTQGPLLWMSC